LDSRELCAPQPADMDYLTPESIVLTSLRTRQWGVAGSDGSALEKALFATFCDEFQRRFNVQIKSLVIEMDGLTSVFMKILVSETELVMDSKGRHEAWVDRKEQCSGKSHV
jgi:hypothetical protein